jgi:putative colanic acid biosynthesis glycosyltransferase
MLETPMFSVITVCYNNLSGLKATYESLVSQSFTGYEWIVIDGGSDDGTSEFLSGLEAGANSWISESDLGIYDAMNKGIRNSRGQYLLFMNSGDKFFSDDVLYNINSQTCLTYPKAFIYGDAYECNAEGVDVFFKKARDVRWIYYGMFAHHQSMFYRRDVIVSNNMSYDFRNYPSAADYAFTSKFLRISGFSVSREELAMSLVSRLFVYALQALFFGIRKYIPSIYAKIKFY